ncbi:unnamed protein product [Rotaria magnacalcarata]
MKDKFKIKLYKLHSRIYQEESICKCVFSSINSNNVISFQIRCNLQSSDDTIFTYRSTAIMLYSFDLLAPVFVFVLDLLLCWHHASV